MRIVKETLGGEKTQLGAGDLELIHRLAADDRRENRKIYAFAVNL